MMIDETCSTASGSTYTRRIVNPLAKIATSLENSIRAALQQLGATPATRERAKPAEKSKNAKPAPLTPEEEYEQRLHNVPEPEEPIEVDIEEDENE